jgi:hypothetical protein
LPCPKPTLHFIPFFLTNILNFLGFRTVATEQLPSFPIALFLLQAYGKITSPAGSTNVPLECSLDLWIEILTKTSVLNLSLADGTQLGNAKIYSVQYWTHRMHSFRSGERKSEWELHH